MLTTAVFSICLTAPLGAIFINTLGTKWLNYDGDVDMNEEDEENAETKAGKAGTEGQHALEVEDFDGDDETRKIETGRGGKEDPSGATVVPLSEDAKTIKTDKVN